MRLHNDPTAKELAEIAMKSSKIYLMLLHVRMVRCTIVLISHWKKLLGYNSQVYSPVDVKSMIDNQMQKIYIFRNKFCSYHQLGFLPF